MAKKPAPKLTHVWKVTYKTGWMQQNEETVDLVAYDVPELLERWEKHVARSLKYTTTPTIVKLERGQVVYA